MLPRLAAVALAAAVLAVPAPADASPHRKVPDGFFGVMADGPLTDGLVAPGPEFARMSASGVESVRVAFDWSHAQPSEHGTIDFSETDAFVAGAAARNLRVLPVVLHAPAWAVDGSPEYGSPPRDPADYAAYVGALVRRYGPGGAFWAQHPGLRVVPIRVWQIWNEPNIPFYWSKQPFAASYVRLLKAARAAIRAADRRATVLLAGMPNAARSPSWVALRMILRAGGARQFDAVALHPYTSKIANIVKTVRYARAEMRRRGGIKPVWLTEISWSSSNGHTTDRFATWDTTERGQARMVRDALTTLARRRRALGIRQVTWYTWLSPQVRRSKWFDYAGLSRMQDGRVVRKPALKAFARVARRLAGR
jgi:polysaccharide biosynthesis protein PslG